MTATKMSYVVHFICILCVLNTVNLVNGFSKDSACGWTHGCWGNCDGGCSFLLTWMSYGSSVTFTIKASLTSNADQWAGFGISTSASMQNASVTSCLMTNNSVVFSAENSYNAASGNTNAVVSNPQAGILTIGATYANNILTCELTRINTNSDAEVFDLTTDYYILFAKGTLSGGTKNQHTFTDKTDVLVDFQSTQDLTGGVAIIKPFTSILFMLNVSQIVLFSM
ncbi:putative ferric-chelate reductase 1 [Mytilus edulis]|uniref:putative ferric-chelate reductase 1 n=1 Tax=Mytilus edulis TaxID=6550 RepID=UPI0039EF71FC